MKTSPLNLGPGPSVLGDDPASRMQRDAGYQVSDFHGAFTRGAVFQPTHRFIALGPLDVVHAGAVDVKGALAVFDPGSAFASELVQPFLREVPSGRHDVFLCTCKGDEGVIASCVRFKDAPVARWTPALFDPTCPRPPVLPMFSIRSVVGFGDADAARAMSNDDDEDEGVYEENAWGRLHEGDVLARDGVVAFSVGGAGSYASWFGEDVDGGVVALATEYGMLRILAVDTVVVPVAAAVKKSVRVHDVHVSALVDGGKTTVIVRTNEQFGSPQEIVVEDAAGAEHGAAKTTWSAGITTCAFDVAGKIIKLDFAGISVPRLRRDVRAVHELLEAWRARDLIAVDAAHVHALAKRFVKDPDGNDVRSWLMEQDEVDEVFF